MRVTHPRTGLGIGPGGGLLQPIARLFRFGLGGRLGNGRQWMSWISRADTLAAIEFLLTADEGTGAVNLTGPAPVTNREFTRTLGPGLHPPPILPLPRV